MKIAFHSMAGAALTASVSGFISPSSFSPMTGGVFVDENRVCTPTFADGGQFCAPTHSSSSSLKVANDDEDLEVFVDDMLAMSAFVYDLRGTFTFVEHCVILALLDPIRFATFVRSIISERLCP